MIQSVCEQCPWRAANQGKRNFGGFYTRRNLTRLWNQIRRGGSSQSCHLSDPSHPDHLTAGCPPGARTRECPGSVILVLREIGRMADEQHTVTEHSHRRYQGERKRGLTPSGILYWLIQRYQWGGAPIVGGPPLPEVAVGDPAISLPAYLEG
jgi:hypothetical protein